MARSPRKSPTRLTKAARKTAYKDRVAMALRVLTLSGIKVGRRACRVDVIVDADVLKAAVARSGFSDNSVVVNGALAILVAHDDFGRYLLTEVGRLSDDFQSAV